MISERIISKKMDLDSHSDSQIKKFYQLKNIAVVGMSKNEEKPSNQVPKKRHFLKKSKIFKEKRFFEAVFCCY